MQKRGPTKLFKFPIKRNNTHPSWYEAGAMLTKAGIKFSYRLMVLRNMKGDFVADVQGVHVTFETGADYTHFLLKFGGKPLGIQHQHYYIDVAKSATLVNVDDYWKT